MNSRCTRAISRPAAAFGPETARAASSAVTVVPTLAPMVTGNACSSRSSPAPASGTSSDVVMELDCTRTVTIAPTSMATTALELSARSTMPSTREVTADRMTFTSRNSAKKMKAPLTPTRKTACPPGAAKSASAAAATGANPASSAVPSGLSYSTPSTWPSAPASRLAALLK